MTDMSLKHVSIINLMMSHEKTVAVVTFQKLSTWRHLLRGRTQMTSLEQGQVFFFTWLHYYQRRAITYGGKGSTNLKNKTSLSNKPFIDPLVPLILKLCKGKVIIIFLWNFTKMVSHYESNSFILSIRNLDGV